MSGPEADTGDKTHEPTPQKLRKARENGDIPRSADLSVTASYAGLLIAATATGVATLTGLGQTLMVFLDRPDRLAGLFFDGQRTGPWAGLLFAVARPLAPVFLIPGLAVFLSIAAQRGLVATPDKLRLKPSRVSMLANAKNKFGRRGLFEFAKSFAKLLLYSACLGAFLDLRLPEIIAAAGGGPRAAAAMMARLSLELLFLVTLVSAAIGAVDAVWQHADYKRRNRMSHKELTDETKEAEGDPHMKQQRRQRGYEIASTRMMAEVPDADVVIVNPTHYAVALKWSRLPGSAPVCVAKGVDDLAAAIRRKAEEAGVPIHGDPPTARALFATVDLGQEIAEEHFRAVAAAIRFAERMRQRARQQIR